MNNKIPTRKATYKFFENYTDGYGYVAKLALEKQIPKKVIVNKDGCRNCPNCYTNESWICYEQDINEPFEYCANCGQKLDWSDYDG